MGSIRWGKSGPFNQTRIIAIGMPMSTRSTSQKEKFLSPEITIFSPPAKKVSSDFRPRTPSRFYVDSVSLVKIPARYKTVLHVERKEVATRGIFRRNSQATVMKRGTGFEPATTSLEGWCSATELPPRAIEPTFFG